MGRQTVKASSEQEDGTNPISTAMVVHGVSSHPAQGNARQSRFSRITKQMKMYCSCTWSLACKMKLCKCKQAGTACQRCNFYQVCANQPEWIARLKEIEATEEQEKTTEDITKMSAPTTAPKQPSPKAKGTIRQSPK